MNAQIEPANEVHATAIVEGQIGRGNRIGPFCYIGPDAVIGDGNTLISHVTIGTPGQYRGEVSAGGVSVGDRNTFHEHSNVQCAMKRGALTVVGDDGYFMVNAHIAHDCVIEDSVTMCNNATLGGETRVMKGATLGFGSIVHQQQTVGGYSMLGMGAVVPKGESIEPGEKYAGNPIRHLGRNTHALKKHNIRDTKDEAIRFEMARSPRSGGGFAAAVGDLQEYMKTRSRAFQGRRYDILRDVVGELPYMRENDAANVYNMAFSLCWQQHEDFQADQIIIRETLIDAIGQGEPRGNAKGKIGWLVNHLALGTYAPYKHVYAYLSGMEPCEIIVHGSVREQEAGSLLDMGHNITHIEGGGEGATDAVREVCEERGIACLISDIYLSTPLWAFKKRAAPMQAYLSPGFQLFPADVVLLPETQERIRCEARLSSESTEAIPTAVVKDHLYQPVARKKKGKVFGCLSRAEKCSADYLRMVQRVLDDNPGSEFHFYGRGDLDVQDARFRARGIQNPHHALAQMDVYLDTWPSCSGLSAYEAMAHGVPVVTLDHASVHSWNQFKPWVVNTEAEYVQAAGEALGIKGEQAAAAGREIVESRIANIPRAARELYAALERQGWQA